MDVDVPSDISDASVVGSNTCPKDSDAVKPNDNDDDSDEEFFIMADIGHDMDQQTVMEYASNSEIRAINIDGTNPFIQIGPYTFQGQYNYSLGTNLFFSTTSINTDHNVQTNNRIDESTSHHSINNDIRLMGSSDKKLNLSRVYIYPKKNDDSSKS
jgi:hypothetical protein